MRRFESEYGVEFLLRIQGSLVERREIRLVAKNRVYNSLIVNKQRVLEPI